MKYTVHGQLADLNKHDGMNRVNKFGGASLKKQQTDLVAWQLKGESKITEPCIISFIWYYSSKHDFDNMRFACKYVLDGMVKADILPDDNQKWVKGFGGDTFIKVAKGDEKVEVVVDKHKTIDLV